MKKLFKLFRKTKQDNTAVVNELRKIIESVGGKAGYGYLSGKRIAKIMVLLEKIK